MPEVVDIAEEARRYKDEWVLFEVTELDEFDRPVKGRLLFHGASREELHREAMKHQDVLDYAFFTGPIVPPGMVVVL
jgi:hypothetical protein